MEETMPEKLVAEEGLLKELVLSFEEGEQWVIGRDPDACQLLVEDPAASRKHLLCRRTPEGILIENLSSTNPTQVNGEEIPESYLLRQGDVVKIGDTVFRFYGQPDVQLEESSPEPEVEEPIEEKYRPTVLAGDKTKAPPAVEVNFDLLDTGRWLLKVISGPNTGAEFSMQTGNSYVIGTDPNSCDVVFYDTSVSRQHAKITVDKDDALTIEDLKSRNGTRIEGELISTKQPLANNAVVSTGTTSFVVYDREGEMQTIISPLLPSIVKVLQKEDQEAQKAAEVAPPAAVAPTPPPPPAKTSHTFGMFILTAIIIGLFTITGIALQTLFKQETVVEKQEVNPDKDIAAALSAFPNVKFSFNKTTGRLFLVGHVLTSSDHNQLVYNLQGLPYIHDIDDSGVIIDEYVWTEANQVLSKNPAWKGVTVHSPEAGRFVVSGYLQTRMQAEQVWDYLTRNFPYIDLLDNKIIVEEDIIGVASSALLSQGFNTVKVSISNGELTFSGNIQKGRKQALDALLEQFKSTPGVRLVRNVVVEKAPSEAVINISDQYVVSGTSVADGGKLNVIINGRIVTEGDILDGMRITDIQPTYVLLEKEGTTYRIDIR